MKKAVILLAVVLGATVFASNAVGQDEIIGPISLANRFPKMMEVETCSQAYDDFKGIASPIRSCHDLRKQAFEAKTQQAVIDALAGLKGNEAEVKTNQARMKLNEANSKIIDLKGQCPTGKKFVQLIHQLEKKVKDVCERCDNKWPGELGPLGGTPCR